MSRRASPSSFPSNPEVVSRLEPRITARRAAPEPRSPVAEYSRAAHNIPRMARNRQTIHQLPSLQERKKRPINFRETPKLPKYPKSLALRTVGGDPPAEPADLLINSNRFSDETGRVSGVGRGRADWGPGGPGSRGCRNSPVAARSA